MERMRRTARPTRPQQDDLEESSWKRKSYALAQCNALPIPMPFPVYPPPKPCPPPAVVIRPSRLRSRPPGASYRPPLGYRQPASNYPSPGQNYYQGPQPQPDRLPTLSETNAGTEDSPVRKAPPSRGLPTLHDSPLERDGIPFSPPELITFRAPSPKPPPRRTNVLSSQASPDDIPGSPPKLNDVSSSPTRPAPSRPAATSSLPPSGDHLAKHEPPATHSTFNTLLHLDPHLEPMTTPPSPTTYLPQETCNAPPTQAALPKTPLSLPSKPPRTVKTRGTRTDQPVPSPPSPARQIHQIRSPPSPRPREPPPSVPSYTSRLPESGYSSHDSLSTSPPDSFITEPRPPSPPHPRTLSRPVINSDPESHSHPADTDLALTLVSHAQASPRVCPSPHPYTETDFDVSQSTENISGPNFSPKKSKLPSLRPSSHEEEIILTPQCTKVSESHTDECNSTSFPPVDERNPQLAAPANQHLPPTSPSQSCSSAPHPLARPRTPTSIRAAPSWQPMFPATPLIRRSKGASNSERSSSPSSSTPSPYPSMEPEGAQGFLPTPPSSPSQARVDSVTSPSSVLSFSHGHGHSHAPEEENARDAEANAPTENGPDAPCSSLPDKMPQKTLPVDDETTPPAANNSSSPSEELGAAPSKPVPETFQTYKTRFWILAVFSFIGFLQTIVWGTFGPIAESAQAAFPSWDDSTIAAFPNWGPIIVSVFTIPMVWLSQRLGLQMAMVVCALFLTVGTMLRCFTSQEAAFTVICHVSAALFAFAACFTLSLPAMVAATWFPPSERITATAVGTLMCQLGGAALYLGALVVRYPSGEPHEISEDERENIRGDIMVLMYIHFGASVLLLLAVGIYFPAQPPTPPSASSTEERIDYFKAIKTIFRKPHLLMVLVVVAFSFGVPVVWIGVLNLSLKEIGIYQEQAIGVAVTAVVCSSASAFIAARIADKMYGHLKVTIMVLLGISSVFFLWFLLLTTKVISPSLGQVYAAVTGGLCFEYATVPLLVELAVEIGFPIPENVTGASLTFAFNLVALVFLGLFQIPNNSHLWVSCVLLACVSLSIIPLFFVKETHKRSDTDRKIISRSSK